MQEAPSALQRLMREHARVDRVLEARLRRAARERDVGRWSRSRDVQALLNDDSAFTLRIHFTLFTSTEEPSSSSELPAGDKRPAQEHLRPPQNVQRRTLGDDSHSATPAAHPPELCDSEVQQPPQLVAGCAVAPENGPRRPVQARATLEGLAKRWTLRIFADVIDARTGQACPSRSLCTFLRSLRVALDSTLYPHGCRVEWSRSSADVHGDAGSRRGMCDCKPEESTDAGLAAGFEMSRPLFATSSDVRVEMQFEDACTADGTLKFVPSDLLRNNLGCNALVTRAGAAEMLWCYICSRRLQSAESNSSALADAFLHELIGTASHAASSSSAHDVKMKPRVSFSELSAALNAHLMPLADEAHLQTFIFRVGPEMKDVEESCFEVRFDGCTVNSTRASTMDGQGKPGHAQKSQSIENELSVVERRANAALRELSVKRQRRDFFTALALSPHRMIARVLHSQAADLRCFGGGFEAIRRAQRRTAFYQEPWARHAALRYLLRSALFPASAQSSPSAEP